MPITPSNIQFDLSGYPALLQTFVSDLDTALATGWTVGTRAREFTFQWANYGGYSQAKADYVKEVLQFYLGRGWVQAQVHRNTNKTNTTQFTLIFEW